MFIREGDIFDDNSTISWSLNEQVSDARLFYSYEDTDELTSLSDDHYQSIIIDNTYKHYKLVVPIHRFEVNKTIIELPSKEITVKEFLEILYNFYNTKKLTLDDLKNLDQEDCFGYIKNAIDRVTKGEDVYYINIMGDLKFYEGLYICGNSVLLKLGS